MFCAAQHEAVSLADMNPRSAGGLSSTSDKMFQTSFTDIYTDNTLQVPWYLVLG